MPPALVTTTAPDPFRIARRVLPLILLHALWSCCVVGVRLLSRRVWRCDPLLHYLTGSVLGLLLAFRTNQAYNRYWSACSSWATIHKATHNLARQVSQLYLGAPPRSADRRRFAQLGYPSFIRHLIALPIALKQRLRGTADSRELWAVLLASEAELLLATPSPHLALLASLSLLALPLRNGDDGSGKGLALWGELERGIAEIQSAVCLLDLVARLPPPASYMVHTARFLALWTLSLPLVLVDKIHPCAVPPVVLAVAWALYSTEELAKTLDEPFGRPGEAASTETVPVEMYVEQIVRELREQVGIARALGRRLDDGTWAVSRDDLEQPAYPPDSAPTVDTEFDAEADGV